MNKKQPVRTCECLLAVKVSNGFSFQITVDKSQITIATSDDTIDDSNAVHRNDRTRQVESSEDPMVRTTWHPGSVGSHKAAPIARQKPPSSSKPSKTEPVDTQNGTKISS